MPVPAARPARPVRPPRRRARSRRPVRALLGAVVACLLAGCQGSGTSPGTGSGGAGPSGDDGGGMPTPGSAADVVLVVRTGGGFVPAGYDFSAVPSLVVYGDGTVVVPGAQVDVFPGPALQELQVHRLSDAQLADLVEAAADAGLLADPPDYGWPGVTDLPTTQVELTVDGRTYAHGAYALGFADDELPPAQSEARTALRGFLDRADGLVAAAAERGWEYDPTAVAVMALPTQRELPAGQEGQARTVVAWPLDDVALADASRCRVVAGPEAVALLEVAREADQLTVFDQGGATYGVWFRPLLPHEHTCADLGYTE